MCMFGIFFMLFDLLSCSSSIVVYSKLYTSFTQTILVADECRDTIIETTFLQKSPHVYLDPHLQTMSLSAGVGVVSLHMKPISTKQIYSRGLLAVGDMLHFSRALLS